MQMESSKRHAPKVLVIRRRYLGDLVLIGPVFRNLRLHHPQGWITAVVDEPYTEVLSRNRDVNEVLALPQRQSESGGVYARRWLQFVFRIRARRFDVVYDLTHNSRSALVTVLSRARTRVNYVVPGVKSWKYRLYNVHAHLTMEDFQSRHMVEYYLKLLTANHVPIVTTSVSLDMNPEDHQDARAYLEEVIPRNHQPLIAVHPGARVATKCWQTERFAALCDEIQISLGAKVLLLSGRGEEGAVREIRSAMQTDAAVLSRRLSVPQLAALLQQADLFVGHNSGPMHVAAAVGTPVVALFGAHLPALWGPPGEGHIVVRPSMPCDPCAFPDLCDPRDWDKTLCVRRITVDEVLAAVQQQLARAGHQTDNANVSSPHST